VTATAITERISLPLGFDRRVRGLNRRRDYLLHTESVLAARADLIRSQGRLPFWEPTGALRTVYPTGRVTR
jgi:hypothetical protein